MKKIISIITLLAVVSIIFTGCSSFSGISIMKVGSTTSQSMKYKYKLFDGVHNASFHMKKDTKVKVNYNLKIEKGSLTIKMINSEKEPIWETKFEESTKNEIILEFKEEGRYKLTVEGEKTKGGFEIKYSEIE